MVAASTRTSDVRRISLPAARRIAVAAQGLDQRRPSGRVDRRHLRRVYDRLGIIQIDSVNVLARSQELPLFARLGPHPRTLLFDALDRGELFEAWVHVASLVPAADYPLYHWRIDTHRTGDDYREFAAAHGATIDRVLAQIDADGALSVGDVDGRERNRGGSWWDWDETKHVLEWLFRVGVLAATRRPRDFARRYDRFERVVDPVAFATPPLSRTAAVRELTLRAARHLGVATVNDIADYHRHKPTSISPVVDELVAAGELIPVAVDGWKRAAVLHPEAAAPRRACGTALLSPFDSLVWFRQRTEALFDFHYRIEIYTPAPKRRFGYYVLPFLLDGELVGRVDLKADRANGVLRAQGAFVEPDFDSSTDRGRIADALAGELQTMASWLGLEAVGVGDRGELVGELRRRGLESLAD